MKFCPMIKFSRPAARPARCHAELRDRLDHVTFDGAIGAQRAVGRDMITAEGSDQPGSVMGAYSNQSKSATVVLGAPLLVAWTPTTAPKKPPATVELKIRPSTEATVWSP